ARPGAHREAGRPIARRPPRGCVAYAAVDTQKGVGRLRRRFRSLVLGAAGIVLLSRAGIRVGGGEASSAITPPPARDALLVTSRPINAGTVLAPGAAEVRRVPPAEVPP